MIDRVKPADILRRRAAMLREEVEYLENCAVIIEGMNLVEDSAIEHLIKNLLRRAKANDPMTSGRSVV